MSWSGVVEPPPQQQEAPVSAARRKEPPVERFGCAQKQELNEIFGTIFDRQLNSSRQRDLHIRVVFETNQMEDSSSSVCATTSRTTSSSSMSVLERSIGSTAGIPISRAKSIVCSGCERLWRMMGMTPLPQSPAAVTPTKS